LLAADTGARSELAAVGVSLDSASLDDWPEPANRARPTTEEAAGSPRLRSDLVTLALDPDNRLVPARGFAIDALAELPASEVTRDLLDIYAQTTMPPELKQRVSRALRTRRAGVEHLVDALLARYDFLEQSRPAPLSLLVPAIVQARETRAVPRLIERMNDHETPLSVLPAIVKAVTELGDATVVAPLLDFLRLYRSDSSFASEPDALLSAAAGVLRHGDSEQREMLAQLARAQGTSLPLSQGIAELLQPPASDRRIADQRRPAPEEPALPESLSQRAVNAVFARHIDDTRLCAIDELGRNPKLAQVRVAFIVEHDGTAHAWTFAPNSAEFVDCLYPKVRDYRFPRFARARQVARYVVALHTRSRDAAPEAPAPGDAPFWASAARTPAAEDRGRGPSWWQSQQPLAPLAEARPAPTAEPAITVDEEPAATSEERSSDAQPPAQAPTNAEPPSQDQWWLPPGAHQGHP
jgi:hypothetical protein